MLESDAAPPQAHANKPGRGPVEARRTRLALTAYVIHELVMSKFSASDAAFSGFRLVRENLRSVSVWMLIMTVTSIISSVVMIHFFGKQLEMFSASMPPPGSEPNPEDLRKGIEAMIPTLLVS